MIIEFVLDAFDYKTTFCRFDECEGSNNPEQEHSKKISYEFSSS